MEKALLLITGILLISASVFLKKLDNKSVKKEKGGIGLQIDFFNQLYYKVLFLCGVFLVISAFLTVIKI